MGERPEDQSVDRKIYWYHYAPAAVCLFGAIALIIAVVLLVLTQPTLPPRLQLAKH